MLTKEGVRTAPLAMKAPLRTTVPGRMRTPAASKRAASQPVNFSGTLSQ